MQLVIAEKPSVARDLGRVMGARASGGSKLEGGGRVITWCIGHLVELEEPAAYDQRWKSWRMDTLPMVPEVFKLRPVRGTREQLRAVTDLLRDARFKEVVNGCDAGREGELIFRYVYQLAGSRLPVRRLWVSSLTDDAIKQGFSSLRPGRDYDGLADAARCRSEADWLVGMNATRAVTLAFRASSPAAAARPAPPRPARGRGRRAAMPPIYSIGRVQTPTLAIVVRRDQAIRAFVPRDYWEVRGTFAASDAAARGAGDGAEEFTALWTLRPEAGDGSGKDGGAAAVTRFGARDAAAAVVARSAVTAAEPAPGGAVVESLVEKRSREPPPQLFDLTSLQRTANRRHGFSATRTLEAAQALYERHKLITYPRTDSRHLPRDQVGELPKLFRGMAQIPEYAPFAQPLLAQTPAAALASRRIFDDAKVHDHHAIIPTGKVVAAGALAPDEAKIFDLVARRFLGAFHPDAEFALTRAVVRVGPPAAGGPAKARAQREAGEAGADAMLAEPPPPPDRFVARGRVRLSAGWQAVAGIDERRGGAKDRGKRRGDGNGDRADGERDEGDATLPPLAEGQRLDGRFEAVARQTRPPPHHTEATLLGAMESAGREVEDEALRAAMKDTGLGTPATRAATIETLVERGFIAREAKQVVATPTGIALIEQLPVPNLASPELTGAWEARLVRISRGQEARSAFMTDIVRYVEEVMSAVRGGRGGPARPPAAAAPAAPAAVGAAAGLGCPRCREGTLITGKRGWGCSRWRQGCSFVIWFERDGRRISEAELPALVERAAADARAATASRRTS
jgi:DNA topoisomerase-3